MKVVIVFFSLLVSTAVANTPDLCTANIKNLRLMKPSEVDPTGRQGPDIKVGSTVYTNDEPHMIIGAPATVKHGKSTKNRRRNKATKGRDKMNKGEKSQKVKKSKMSGEIIVYLPGTTDWPAQSSCLLEVLEANEHTVIGLTAGYLSRGDKFRNARCASLETEQQVECLTEQHKDAIYGGTYGADRIYTDGNTFWAPVDARDSIAGRLGLLLAKLDMEDPEEGWDAYYHPARGSYPDNLPMPKWSKFVFMGHSQGAGHAAYLAKTLNIAGAALLSGPQDSCLECPDDTKFWVDEPFVTSKITAFAHGSDAKGYEEGLPAIRDNWNRMADTGSISFTSPVNPVDTGSYAKYDVCATPIFTFLEPADITPDPIKPCGSMGHCSTALDAHAPVLNNTSAENTYVFGLDIWANLAGVSSC